jgi:hypothetical protein
MLKFTVAGGRDIQIPLPEKDSRYADRVSAPLGRDGDTHTGPVEMDSWGW